MGVVSLMSAKSLMIFSFVTFMLAWVLKVWSQKPDASGGLVKVDSVQMDTAADAFFIIALILMFFAFLRVMSWV